MSEPKWCPVFRPTKAEFEQPFCDYVTSIFKQDPMLPMFKVIPPAGWRARRSSFPDLKNVMINTPIRQHAFGQRGAYRCLFVEQKKMSVADYKKLATEEAEKLAGHKGQSGSASAGGVVAHNVTRMSARSTLQQADDLSERSFWASVTLNPPLYGADTPYSFFDQTLPYGWNLRDLKDLLKTRDVPEIPGVTTPMTYFGMWRSFFGWHKEDADLLSVNYHHFGAPKVWYCVSPADMAKFERMAEQLFPDRVKECKAFIRHKDILVSPTVLRNYNIPYTQAKQQPGEFMVLNAAAYHGGFNMGFNCAEAVNFATDDWVKVGKIAGHCTCRALKDCVRISMRLFDPNWRESGDESDSEDDSDAPHGLQLICSHHHQQHEDSAASDHTNTSHGRHGGSKRGSPASAPSSGKRAKGDAGGPGAVEKKLLEEEVAGTPFAIVHEDDNGKRSFDLVQQLKRPAAKKGQVVLRHLAAGKDGLYRPIDEYSEQKQSTLVTVRCQVMNAKPGASAPPPGQLPVYKLLTLRSRILDTDLLD